ncbi:sortase-dependent protein [Streptomyces sp. CA-179760]|uniref:sortase-dependent protein n=1 Tax=Streptomyces sp. CA-179760 TaxID=3240054 RepID=UPI003D907D65
MRRTVLSALALAGTAVLLGTGPAFADGGNSPSPVPSATPATTPQPEASAEPTRAPADTDSTPTAPKPEPTRAPAEDQVSVRPGGAPDTGVTPGSSSSGSDGTAIGAGAAAAFALGGTAVFVVRRRRATGA